MKTGEMNRRQVLQGAGVAGGVALLGGAALWGRRAHARNQLEEQLLRTAEPLMTQKASHELGRLPAEARDEIRLWFHNRCKDAKPFAVEVCSESFREKLFRLETEAQKRELFLAAFLSTVTSQASILNRVHVIAEEIGGELDQKWENCSREISTRWETDIREYGESTPHGFAQSLTSQVETAIHDSIEAARAAGQRPAFTKTADSIGESALALLPLAVYSAGVAVPVFVVVAVGHLYDYFRGRIDRKESEEVIRRSVSTRLALLGNRIGAEFEEAIRTCIARLHDWQQGALQLAAKRRAHEAIGII